MSAGERRERIERAAEEVFAERGYHGASMGAIAERAGISKPVIYDHFPSKRDLHVQLMHGSCDALFAIQAERMGGDTFDERIRSSLQAYFEYIEQNPYPARMLFRESTGDPELAAAHAEVVALADRRIAAFLRLEGVEDPELAAVILRNAIDGVSVWWRDHPERSRAEVAETAIELVLNGIRGREAAG